MQIVVLMFGLLFVAACDKLNSPEPKVEPATVFTESISPCTATRTEPFKDGYRNVPDGQGFQHAMKKERGEQILENRPTSHCIPCARAHTSSEKFVCDGGTRKEKG